MQILTNKTRSRTESQRGSHPKKSNLGCSHDAKLTLNMHSEKRPFFPSPWAQLVS